MFEKIINLFKNTNTIKTPEPSVSSVPVENFSYAEALVEATDVSKSLKGTVISARVLSGGLAVGFKNEGGVDIKGLEVGGEKRDTAVVGDEVRILTTISDRELVELYIAEQPNNMIRFYKK